MIKNKEVRNVKERRMFCSTLDPDRVEQHEKEFQISVIPDSDWYLVFEIVTHTIEVEPFILKHVMPLDYE